MQKNMMLCKGFHILLNKHSSWSSPPLARAVSRLTLLLTLMFIPILSWAGVHFKDEKYSKFVNHPTVDRPYMQLKLFMYDLDGGDGFFMHDAVEGGNKGPAIYVDGKYICSADNELARPGSNGTGNDSGLEDDRRFDGYYGNKYTKTIDGVTYTIRFWTPCPFRENLIRNMGLVSSLQRQIAKTTTTDLNHPRLYHIRNMPRAHRNSSKRLNTMMQI